MKKDQRNDTTDTGVLEVSRLGVKVTTGQGPITLSKDHT